MVVALVTAIMTRAAWKVRVILLNMNTVLLRGVSNVIFNFVLLTVEVIRCRLLLDRLVCPVVTVFVIVFTRIAGFLWFRVRLSFNVRMLLTNPVGTAC